jgi:multidrug efflux system outer membrane protein
MQKHALIAVAVACLTAACTMEPKYERPAAPVSAAFPASGVYATQPDPANGGARSANGKAAIDIGWRDFFADARLQRLIELALKNNRDLRVSGGAGGPVPDRQCSGFGNPYAYASGPRAAG